MTHEYFIIKFKKAYWSSRLTWVQESCHVKDLSFGSASHHVSFCSSRLNSSQEPEENRVAPLRPIALRRSSQWKNHQKLRENISTQGTVRSESQCTKSILKTYLKSLLSVPYIPELFLSPDGYASRHVALIQLYTCHHLEPPQLERYFYSFRHSTKLSIQGVTWYTAFLIVWRCAPFGGV